MRRMVQTVRFYAISDFGNVNRQILSVAAAMDRYATECNKPPDFICGLGDNFYPHGVESVMDEQFKTIWRDTFLRYASLRVPWRMVLGNHDYMWNPYAQIDYHHNKKLNSDGLWYMPDHIYQFQYKVDKPHGEESKGEEGKAENGSNSAGVDIDFFAIDTNACQSHVVHSFPQIPINMKKQIGVFRENLTRSTAHWKIVIGHHPMYTQGLGHGSTALCLREKEYPSTRSDKIYKGYAVEKIFLDGKVDAYFAGHEHIFQVSLMTLVHDIISNFILLLFVVSSSSWDRTLLLRWLRS
jgi:tartrate-resistant acid phosphatase type 5